MFTTSRIGETHLYSQVTQPRALIQTHVDNEGGVSHVLCVVRYTEHASGQQCTDESKLLPFCVADLNDSPVQLLAGRNSDSRDCCTWLRSRGRARP